jgi:hypothetical protein
VKGDPIVDEVRRAGKAYFAKFKFDLKAICEDLRRRSREEGRKVVSLPPRRVKGKAGTGKQVG